jgi:hypothetical protein
MTKRQNGEEKKNQALRKLIDVGSEIAGGAAGGALGFLAAGPAGAALLGAGGAAAAKLLKDIGSEISERFLSSREKVRVGGVLAIAAVEIKQRIENGEEIRDDGFFENKADKRSSAEEVVESILLKSQSEPEEKKIPYMGHLIANLAFHKEYSIEMAHQISKAVEQLTYRQLCLLKLSVIKNNINLREENYRGQNTFSKELYQILYEYLELCHHGFVNMGGEVALGPTDIAPGKISLQGLGADIYNLMQLSKIPNEDLISTVLILQ